MNIFPGIIKNIQSVDALSVVVVKVHEITLNVLLVDTPDTATYLREEEPVNLLFKETAVILSKNLLTDFSIPNIFSCEIIDIERGILLSRLTLSLSTSFEFYSLISSEILDQLSLQRGNSIYAAIKMNNIMLKKR